MTSRKGYTNASPALPIYEPEHIPKSEVVLAIANAILRLGKNDWHGVEESLNNAQKIFKLWRTQSIQEGFHKP